MIRNLLLSLPAFFCFPLTLLDAQTQSLGLRVPDGFEVTAFTDRSQANDIYCLTLDPKGRVVVSGRGYIRLLLDDNGDGRTERASLCSDVCLHGRSSRFCAWQPR